MLLDQGADVNHMDDYGETPLSLAVAYRRYDMMQLLLMRGAKTTSHEALSQLLLSHATIRHSEPCVELLLRWGADLEAKSPPFLETPLSSIPLDPEGKRLLTNQVSHGYVGKHRFFLLVKPYPHHALAIWKPLGILQTLGALKVHLRILY